MLPNFLIIGAPRAGTTFLLGLLEQHPDVFVARPSFTGDLHFFDEHTRVSLERNAEKGITWYAAQFDGRVAESAVGEKTAYYLSAPEAPAKIAQVLPTARLIAILRNPVERAYSDFWYHRGEFPLDFSFRDILERDHPRLNVLSTGRYAEQIVRYRAHFDELQMLFLILETVKSNPLDTVRRLYRFLQVDEAFVPDDFNRPVNAASAPKGLPQRSKFLAGFLKDRFPRIFQRAVQVLPTRRLETWMQNPGSGSGQGYPPLDPLLRQCLIDYYREDNEQLSDLLQVDLLSLWK